MKRISRRLFLLGLGSLSLLTFPSHPRLRTFISPTWYWRSKRDDYPIVNGWVLHRHDLLPMTDENT